MLSSPKLASESMLYLGWYFIYDINDSPKYTGAAVIYGTIDSLYPKWFQER